MADGYNIEWCREKHEYIDKGFEKVDFRLRKVENRFLAMMTVLIMNLLGVVGTLGLLLLRG